MSLRHPPPIVSFPDPSSDPGLSLDAVTEAAWVDVVHQMEEVYSDLIKYQVEIEEKNQALEETQQFVSSVLTAMTDVLVVCDAQGAIQQVNMALEQVTGQSEAKLIGRSLFELFSPDCKARIEEYLRQVRTHDVQDCEVQLRGLEGAVPLAVNCTSRLDARGRMLGMVLIGRPVGELRKAYDALNRSHAELKRAQQQLINSEKMASLGRLVAGVAHELNNPISFIYGNVHALDSYSRRLQQYLQQVHAGGAQSELDAQRQSLKIDKLLKDLPSLIAGTMEGAERVRDIVMDLRQFSSGQKMQHVEFDLIHVIQTAVHWVTKESRLKVRIGYDLPASFKLLGHPGHIQQVLINLVQNAVDVLADTDKPRIELSVGSDDTKVWFRIRDNGPGIPAENLSRVFDPFFTTKPVGQGTGLGLSLSYGMVADHGGQLSVDNHPDGGAIFTMELPLKGPEAQG